MDRKDVTKNNCATFEELAAQLRQAGFEVDHFHIMKPKIVCLCGSTRFSEAFQKANFRETLEGRIVLTIGCDTRSDAALFGWGVKEVEAIKTKLDELHLRKIDLADEVLILNVGGYVGESTRREIEYAKANGKLIRYLEEPVTAF